MYDSYKAHGLQLVLVYLDKSSQDFEHFLINAVVVSTTISVQNFISFWSVSLERRIVHHDTLGWLKHLSRSKRKILSMSDLRNVFADY